MSSSTEQKLCRGVRGATTVDVNSREAILERTSELLLKIVEMNEMDIDDIASMMFTVTADLDAVYPPAAARHLGWTDVALFTTKEPPVAGSMHRTIRLLIHWNTTKKASELIHCYLHEAARLRPDWADRASGADHSEEQS